jgi:hypothetical protein
MPTTAQIESADPLTAEQAVHLIAALRSCVLYATNRELYPDVETLVEPHIAVVSETSRLLSAVHDVVFGSGLSTVALKGGRDGLDYSKSRDREVELELALDTLIDRPVGAFGFGASERWGSHNLVNEAVF